jgi:hypothetical protein
MNALRPARPLARRAAPFAAAVALAASIAEAACSPGAGASLQPVVDLRPPGLLEAGPSGPMAFVALFDEPVVLVPDSLELEPRATIRGTAKGQELEVEFPEEQSPGRDYCLVGEVDDARGNRTRFLVRFVGWNARPPEMRISEVQTGKNGSQTRPHRDYVELEVLEDGNVGGEELTWSSSVKSVNFRFPGIEVEKGDFLVLHLSPEGEAAEVDELGADTAVSGGVDATPAGRDLWSGAGPLPDESGALCLRKRPGGPVADGFFYADEDKTGAMGEDKLSALVSELSKAGAWPVSGDGPSWDEAFKWKPSSARSICRTAAPAGAASWYVTAAGGQSPGSANAPQAAATSLSKKAVKRK